MVPKLFGHKESFLRNTHEHQTDYGTHLGKYYAKKIFQIKGIATLPSAFSRKLTKEEAEYNLFIEWAWLHNVQEESKCAPSPFRNQVSLPFTCSAKPDLSVPEWNLGQAPELSQSFTSINNWCHVQELK